ncbi:MAG: polyribonucleotide nucleotidyltransferase [Porticoccaceae bacterium]|nr:polyribonucleotide nucleotidyltransferase [Porticoccaceae bacterium]MBT5003301.1 polyribonucleotide nucleotidyltransferase [Porticoccaceae bacterium]MBT6027531.1 polyribonucleotide nucleotidyltransferase [Porticoccaceae bacterium]MBT6422733.1 polyribonucleotide nucleotidyltransferase [Porticoccaceae bacterium]MBT6799135.1 polyribonucleotide nucleotidyltransferase [Porticoccaceae bacterium]
MNPLIKKFQYGNHTVTLETGRIARQATGAVLCSIDNTSVLCTVVGAREAKAGMDFFPLGVHYVEKAYAAGKIPGGFFKREGRPNEKETLTSRLIDRPIRPLFPNGFKNEVQVVCTVMSAEKNIDPDIAAMIGTSAALSISGIPFNGPIGGARVGYTEEQGYLLNPTYSELADSSLDMIVAGTKDAVLMVESEASELSEDTMLGGVLFAHQEMQTVISVIEELASEAGKPRWDWQVEEDNVDLKAALTAAVGADLDAAYQVVDKQARVVSVNALRDRATAELASDDGHSAEDLKDAFKKLEKNIVRGRIIRGEPRIDGRDTKTVRGINVEVGILDRVHGSSLFTRGETQAIVAATLGSTRDSQMIDALEGRRDDPFMLHYNFPPYSVGECGRIGFTSRREVGHGRLARRGINAVLPNPEEFPYAIRVVSEITESNGSSSMASVCGSSLALMDAGVPLKAPVAGIAMGLVKEDQGFAVLTDILGDEDHLGDMDFKVAGTAAGITALQMDIKIEGITEEIMEIALDQAKDARLYILGEMNKVLSTGRDEVAETAPRMGMLQIDSDKIRDVIGKGGATIRGLCEDHNSTIDINDDGAVKIYSEDTDSLNAAMDAIKAIVADPEPGTIYDGKVVRIVDFGAFVNFMPGTDGLVHISQIAQERVAKVTDYLTEGQDVRVKVTEIDNRGRVKLSIKEAQIEEGTVPETAPAETAETEQKPDA